MKKKFILFFSTLLLICIFLLYRQFSPFLSLISQNHINPLLIWNLVRNDSSGLTNFEGRINIVLLGVGGGTHEGEDLTDTLLLISVNPLTRDLAMVSIPRDIYLDSLKDRINTAYHYGGFTLAKSSIKEVVGIPIQYVWLIDFDGFKEVIDAIGGIDITIKESFTDEQYPIQGKENDLCNGDSDFKCRYETVTFDKGVRHMNGSTALKYARSRHATSDQGTDFARGKRQQDIILAIKTKIESEKLWTNPSVVKKLLELSGRITKTDMDWSQRLIFFRLFASLNFSSIRHLSFDDWDPQKKMQGLLINPPLWKYGGAWVLVPPDGNYEKIHKYMKCNLYQKPCIN